MGRGSADSKAAAAIFCHLAARLATITDRSHGSLVLLFDVDEHTGNFGGAKRYFQGSDAPTDVAGVMIGYPGSTTSSSAAAACIAPNFTSTAPPPTPEPRPPPPTPSRRPPT